MKFFIALALVLAVTAVSAMTEEKKQQLKVYGKECVDSTGVDKTKITALRKGVFEEDEKLKKFMACVWQKTGTIKADGTYDIDVIKRDLVDQPAVRDVALKCADKTGTTAAETAYLGYKCFRENLPADYKAPW